MTIRLLPLALAIACASAHAAPEIEARSKALLDIDGQSFKDLNANGKLDAYEDWRLPAAARADDLLLQMTLPEKAGLMLIDTLNAQCQGSLKPDTLDYLHTQHMRRFVFRNTVTGEGTTACKPDAGFRAGSSVTPKEAAQYMNSIQQLGEASRLGIPVLFKSNARNHIDPDARAGINEAAGAMSAFPKEAGIAAAALGAQYLKEGKADIGDMDIVRDFAQVMGAEWRAINLRGMYGYMADLATEPRWYRTHETFSEDADLAANIMTTLVQTLQGKKNTQGVALSADTQVALTLKHFPGGGPQQLGLDPHYAFGKPQIYPAGKFAWHLRPFAAAIDNGVAAIMPYYGVPMDVTHEGTTYAPIGFAFSKEIVTDLLRGQMGFKGYVNSDTGIINDRAWGLEEKSVPERVAAAINGGTDTLSGFHDVNTITDLVARGLVSEARVGEAAKNLLIPMFQMGLFENPYVDAEAANTIVGRDAHREVGMDIQRKSIVLLKNDQNVLPLKNGGKAYILGDFNAEKVAAYGFDVIDGNAENRPSAKGSDYVLISMTAKVKNGKDYASNSAEYGLNPAHHNPQTMPGIKGYDGKSAWGESDACVAYGAEKCTDDSLIFGGAYPWEADILDFSGMAKAQSWEVVPPLETVQKVMAEAGDKNKVILHIYFRQPYVLDEESGLLDAGAIVAGFGVSDTALLDVLTGKAKPQGKMPFALAKTRQAIIDNQPDAPGYPENDTLFPFGFGLSY